jgi:hypothetical protein
MIATALMAAAADAQSLDDRGIGAWTRAVTYRARPASKLAGTCHPPVLLCSETQKKLVFFLSHAFVRTGEALRTCSRPVVRHFHEWSALLPTAPAPLRAETAEPAGSADRPGARTETTSDVGGNLFDEAELRSLIRDPSSSLIFSKLQHAACRGMDPELYHPEQGRPADLILARCFGCRARLACLALAFRAEDPEARCGWYGGLGPGDRDALAASAGGPGPSAAPASDAEARAVRLRAAGWTIGSIAAELRCSRRTVQRYLRKAVA